MSKLQELKKLTTVVSDSGDFKTIEKYKPQDATTNPSLILAAAQKPEYEYIVKDAIKFVKEQNIESKEEAMKLLIDKLMVAFGLEILKIVPGRVSTEVDARISFSTQESLDRARFIISLYEKAGINRERVLIKFASTWEGIRAAEILEREGIHCNMTLLFCLEQAVACADAKVTLISPFVGRILDWYKKSENKESYPAAEDPGVVSVTEIYHYYKKFGHKTQIMGASFRNNEEVLELAGCDLLTISPQLLEELDKTEGAVPKKLDPSQSASKPIEKLVLNESKFRFGVNNNAMATDKLAEGIRNFSKDLIKLEKFLEKYL
ncbi:MAG: transaldolase [Parachlamydiales bacterium]|nr:transaldolase [Parachlamydiales bacterium]